MGMRDKMKAFKNIAETIQLIPIIWITTNEFAVYKNV